ncbi:MAG: ferritin [Deltaproteobacteria bacterium HGW-Deltaproteobacteria-4]|nr:MAG: ferritin [Deltaproteobacteria bacterium HGW-Deltaproteobacteria-4]
MNSPDVCFTFEAALEMAVAMEESGFRHYLAALRSCQRPETKMILRDAALDELDHKYQLEKALVEGTIDHLHFDHPVPTMDLDYLLAQKTLRPDADAREALAYAIHLEKISLDFYLSMASACDGAPMAAIFTRMANDEARHLRSLEDDYETHCLTEN